MTVQIETVHRMQVRQGDLTAEVIAKFLEPVKPEAQVNVSVTTNRANSDDSVVVMSTPVTISG